MHTAQGDTFLLLPLFFALTFFTQRSSFAGMMSQVMGLPRPAASRPRLHIQGSMRISNLYLRMQRLPACMWKSLSCWGLRFDWCVASHAPCSYPAIVPAVSRAIRTPCSYPGSSSRREPLERNNLGRPCVEVIIVVTVDRVAFKELELVIFLVGYREPG
jgi:hypothetical protein